eukprot:1156874-Pelagomonas_calceolata.AAC.6
MLHKSNRFGRALVHVLKSTEQLDMLDTKDTLYAQNLASTQASRECCRDTGFPVRTMWPFCLVVLRCRLPEPLTPSQGVH